MFSVMGLGNRLHSHPQPLVLAMRKTSLTMNLPLMSRKPEMFLPSILWLKPWGKTNTLVFKINVNISCRLNLPLRLVTSSKVTSLPLCQCEGWGQVSHSQRERGDRCTNEMS